MNYICTDCGRKWLSPVRDGCYCGNKNFRDKRDDRVLDVGGECR